MRCWHPCLQFVDSLHLREGTCFVWLMNSLQRTLRECLQLPRDIRKSDLVSDVSLSLKSMTSSDVTAKNSFSVIQWQTCSCTGVLINRIFFLTFPFFLF